MPVTRRSRRPGFLSMRIRYISLHQSQLAARASAQIIEPAVTFERIEKGRVLQRSPRGRCASPSDASRLPRRRHNPDSPLVVSAAALRFTE
jgi:hypothetical protein